MGLLEQGSHINHFRIKEDEKERKIHALEGSSIKYLNVEENDRSKRKIKG